MMIWSDFEFVIPLACIIKTRILDIIWPCLLIIMIMTWRFSGILFICALVVSFAALALRPRAANDTTRAQINNIPSKSHVIPLLWLLIVTTMVLLILMHPTLLLNYKYFFLGELLFFLFCYYPILFIYIYIYIYIVFFPFHTTPSV